MNDGERTALITGSGSGIGRATAEALSLAGHYVVVADQDVVAAEKTVDRIREAGGAASALSVDVTSAESVSALVDAVSDQIGAPTVLVNNVGWNTNERFLDSDQTNWERLLRINLLSVLNVTHAIVPLMVDAPGLRHVVNVASDAGRVGSSGDAVYSAAKGGVIAFTKAMARELAASDVLVNCVCPGPTRTPLFAAMPNGMQEALRRTVPLRRLAEPAEVAAGIAFLASPAATFITGQVLSVSGGATMAD